MNKNFKAYTPITERQIDAVWRKSATLFILDTNILLNLYSYRKNTQEDFFRILEKLKDRIWIPYHVMLEYHRNRLKVINDKENTINEIIKWCKDMRLEFPNDLLEKKDEKNIPQIFKDFSRKYPDLKNEWDKIKKDINNTFSKNKERYIERIKQVTDNGIGINNHDKVYDSLKEILINIGTAYDENFIENIKKIGKERYSHKRPPGYKDVSKDQDEDNVYYHNGCAIPYKYGDLIIWEEIKRYVNNGNNPLKIQNIVFVTDDNKDDWVQKHYSGEKTISMARYELFDELLTEAKHISHFLIADAESFVKQSNKHFNLKLDDGSVNDIKNTANNSRIFSTNQDIIEII
ncbi:PIN domain protein, partial [Gilliamella apicola SCGC AB-598-B02]